MTNERVFPEMLQAAPRAGKFTAIVPMAALTADGGRMAQ